MSFGLLSIRPNMLLITFIHLEVPPDSRDRGITDPRGLHVVASVWMWGPTTPITLFKTSQEARRRQKADWNPVKGHADTIS